MVSTLTNVCCAGSATAVLVYIWFLMFLFLQLLVDYLANPLA